MYFQRNKGDFTMKLIEIINLKADQINFGQYIKLFS